MIPVLQDGDFKIFGKHFHLAQLYFVLNLSWFNWKESLIC